MKIKLKLDLRHCLGHLILFNKGIKKDLTEKFINDFLNFNKITQLNSYLKGKTSFFIPQAPIPNGKGKGKGINFELISVSVKVKFIKDGKKVDRKILEYDIKELKTLSYLSFKRTFYNLLSLKKIDVNTITHVFIIFSAPGAYKYK
jgi:hypothetical protein